ncbi:MAG: TetR/AcrR family transcriptional regulator [Actinomycetia bacterium]|nr:TetR/AcrR family transcriptional regulator [Actinomycetes bacterium]
MPSKTARTLSTADARRDAVVASAVTTFARGGYQTTPIAAVAEHAGISPAYVSKLFTSKTALFVAAVDECYARIADTLERAAKKAHTDSPEEVLHAMGGAYAELIADRDLLMLQVHAQAATDVPEITAAVRRGIGRITEVAANVSHAENDQVQRFVAFGQLCHLLTTVDAFEVDATWAAVLTDGIRHSTAERR